MQDGLCPSCRVVPVKGVQITGSSEVKFLRCEGCIQREEEAERERQAAAHRAKEGERRSWRERHITELLVKCGLDKDSDHLGATIQNFNPHPDRSLPRLAERFVAAFRRGERHNLFLWSQRPEEGIAPGAGKTHIAVAIMRELLISGDITPETALFVRESRMTITLRRLIRSPDKAPEDYLDNLIGRELLILDDVGKAKTDTAWLQELLFELVAGREPRSTIITSNYSPDQLEAMDDFFAALNSRIIGKGAVRCLTGPDRRAERSTALLEVLA